MSVDVNIKGLEPLIAKLEKGINFDEAREVVRMNGAELHRNMQRSAPVDTGHLKRSITMNLSGLTVKVKPTANYSSYIEWGTRFQNPQPFVRPSYQKQRDKFINDLKRLMK